jgi:hypothetical protein
MRVIQSTPLVLLRSQKNVDPRRNYNYRPFETVIWHRGCTQAVTIQIRHWRDDKISQQP